MGSLPKSKKKKIPKNISEMSKETLQETLQKKRECNVKAQKIVEAMCEESINEEWFLINLEFINQCHFEDVTIERALLKICGYPLCNNKLEKIMPQQYHISTRYNKVFDITERKNFCSSSCYKAANYIKNQMLTSPLWFRDHEVIPKFTILKSNKSSLGEEVHIYEKITLEPDDKKLTEKIDSDNVEKLQDKCSKLSIKNESFVEIISEKNSKLDLKNSITNVENMYSDEKGGKKNDKTVEENNTSNFKIQVENCEQILNIDKEKNYLENKLDNSECNKKETFNPETNFSVKENNVFDKNKEFSKHFMQQDFISESVPHAKEKNIEVDSNKKVENCLFEWFSIDSMFFLFGEKKLKELFKDKADTIKETLNKKLSISSYNEKIDRMIKLYELVGTDSLNENMARPSLKPLPDYSALKEEGKNLEIKVRAFFKGELEVKNPALEETEEKKEITQMENDIVLPLVDAHAQVALRRKIVLDKLNKLLPELLFIFNKDYILQMNDVRKLISTFSLNSRNITFKPLEWQLIGIIILKLLSIKDKNLDKIFKLESSQQLLALVLEDFQLSVFYLEDLIKTLTDRETAIQKLQ